MPPHIAWEGAPADGANRVVPEKGPNTDGARGFLPFSCSSLKGHREFDEMTRRDTANRAYPAAIPAEEAGAHPGLFVDRMVREKQDRTVPNAETINRWNEWLSRRHGRSRPPPAPPHAVRGRPPLKVTGRMQDDRDQRNAGRPRRRIVRPARLAPVRGSVAQIA